MDRRARPPSQLVARTGPWASQAVARSSTTFRDQLAHGTLDLGQIAQAFDALCASAPPSSTFWDPTLHGTCRQRTAAFAIGFDGAIANAASLQAAPFEVMLVLCAP